MQVGILTGDLAFREADGTVWLQHGVGRLWNALKERLPESRICLSLLPERAAFMTERLEFPQQDVATFPPLPTTIAAQRKLFKIRRIVKSFSADREVLFMRVPFQATRTLRRLGKPKVLHVVNNVREIVASSTDYRGIWRGLANLMARDTERALRLLVREPRTRTVTNGEELWRGLHAREGRIVVSSCLREAEMQPRDTSDLHVPPRILFVGYLRPEKGVADLLAAFEQVRANRPLKLTLVGAADRPTEAEQTIRQRVDASPFRSDIELSGNVAYGPRLFELYRTHDMLVVPSLTEGTPRTLIEARAFGCPVIGTRVGGIPTSVEDDIDGLLTPPADPAALGQTIEKLLNDHSLRQRLVTAGFARARRHTLEAFADELVAELRMACQLRP